MCIFQRDEGDDEVALGISCESLVLGGDVFEEGRVIELNLVAALFEGYTKALLTLDRFWLVRGVNLDDVIRTLALVLLNLDSFCCIVRSNHTIAHLALQE